ncbi:type II toxin-antitoxin system RelE/ParE family toxin [Propionivibrio sp.]|uniref:type II toxin-antitoxin system RelE/ParE family toxin n=1 Tax=Propionivibrio sp. TaxID=2212460 RepID=UPI0025DC72E3|nr:type II toxin-antitoxin system RelE/ParE family toxin [Propionivibrio sp.]MBK8744114.1 type II toxin-antitoxin system RelE/ParE family toxin [Propionivibrio sp.]
MKKVVRLTSYRQSLRDLSAQVAKDNPMAAARLRINIDDQVSQLSDPNFPRKIGRVKGTFELVAHPNYIVILEESDKIVTVLLVVHARQQWP